MVSEDILFQSASRREAARIALGGSIAVLLLSVSEAGCSQVSPSSEVDVTTFKRRGDRDDSESFARALATGRPVHVPAGEYRVSNVRLANGARLRGEGAGSVIRAADPDAYAMFYADSGSSAAMLAGIDIRDLVLTGDVASRGFREHSHLLVFQGVRGAKVENVGFRGFRGDGLMIEGANALALDPVKEPRHNRDVEVRNCWFDGVNCDNRNAISIVDGQAITITGCRFRNVTRPDMPGAIDIEPNPYPFYRIADIVISDCEFANIGGNFGAIAIFVPQEVAAAPKRLTFIRNRMTDYAGSGADYSIRCANASTAAQNDIRISGHVGQNGQRPFAIFAANGVKIDTDCRFEGYKSASLVGYAERRELVRNVSIAGRYERVGFAGKPNQFGLAVFHVDGLTVAGDWVDCGDGSEDATGVIFLQGASRRVDLSQLVVTAPRRQTKRAVWVAGNHRLDRITSRITNGAGGLPVYTGR